MPKKKHVSRYGEGVCDDVGLGDFIRLHSILDPGSKWPLKIHICLPLSEFNI